MLAIIALAAFEPLFVSRAVADLTPPEPLPLGGYTARMGKKMDPGGEPIFARCLLLKKGGQKVAIVSLETLTIPESLVRETMARLPKDVQLFLASTHTHCAPDSQMLNDKMTISIPGIAKYDEKWLRWTADKVAECVRKAVATSPKMVLAVGSKRRMLALNRGRRLGAAPLPDAVLMSDSELTNLDVHPSPAETRSLFFHYAAHAVLWGPERNQTSGDWPGALSGVFGNETPVLMGAIGDVSPAAQGETPTERISNFVQTVRLAFPQPSRMDLKPAISIDLGIASQTIDLAPVQAHPDFAKRNGIPDVLAKTVVGTVAPKSGSITTVRLGKALLVGVPGEPSGALGRRIRDAGQNMGFYPVLVTSHVNGWIGYILEADDYAKGGYEASLGFHGPTCAQKVFEASVQAMRALRGPAPGG